MSLLLNEADGFVSGMKNGDMFVNSLHQFSEPLKWSNHQEFILAN